MNELIETELVIAASLASCLGLLDMLKQYEKAEHTARSRKINKAMKAVLELVDSYPGFDKLMLTPKALEFLKSFDPYWEKVLNEPEIDIDPELLHRVKCIFCREGYYADQTTAVFKRAQ